ncbi:hypothetical protein ABIB90_007384 [Bradyrhizobium sp. JR4.1]|uniref:hypothetical protein n=1 Tax=Bradyrhizobium sp. JR4.1 TaxID=3156372 RepID=UPI00339A5381
MRRGAALAAMVIALGVSGVATYQLAPAPAEETARWREIAWPFPRDGWPSGRAFRCDGACAGTELYLRAKRGFCSCDRGVADDDEVDRVADIDLISPRFAAVAPGEEVGIGAMRGRARRYDLDRPDHTRHAALGIAVSRGCDLFVAAAQGSRGTGVMQRAVLVFLQTPEMKTWVTAALDGN